MIFQDSGVLSEYLEALEDSLEDATDLAKDKRILMLSDMKKMVEKVGGDCCGGKKEGCKDANRNCHDYPDSIALPKVPNPGEIIPALSKALSIVYDKNQVRSTYW